MYTCDICGDDCDESYEDVDEAAEDLTSDGWLITSAYSSEYGIDVCTGCRDDLSDHSVVIVWSSKLKSLMQDSRELNLRKARLMEEG